MDNENNNNDTEQAKFFKDILTEGQTNKKDESVWSKEKVIKTDNKKELPLRQFGEFFIITAIINLIVNIAMNFIFKAVIGIYKDMSTDTIIKINNTFKILNFSSFALSLICIIIPYIFFRKYMKRKNATEGLKFLDIFSFGLISIKLSMFFFMFNIIALTNTWRLFNGITIYYIFIIGFCMFIVGRNINDKLLCGIAMGFVGLIVTFSIAWYLLYQHYTAHSIMNGKVYVSIISTIVRYYPYAGQIFLGVYLFFKRNKHNIEIQSLELASQIEE